MKKYPVFGLITILLFACEPASKNEKVEQFALYGEAQGTTFNIRYQGAGAANYQQAVDSILKVIDQSLSNWVGNSTISLFNKQNELTTNDEHFIRMMLESKSIYQISKGAFDTAVMPLVKAWGFGPEGPAVKNDQNIDSLLLLVNWDFDMNMTDDGSGKTVVQFVKNSPVQFDFNAIAQGYSVDVIFEFLKSHGIVDMMVEIGGEVRAMGKNDKGELWRIGIDKPVDEAERTLQAVAEINNKAIATSGNYRKFYEKDGQRYAHTINPKTGYPVQHNLLSATVLAETCANADAYATVFMVLGLEESLTFLQNHPELNLEAYFIHSDADGTLQTHFTEGMKGIVKELED
jgi:thiamine biosynthesis lipoprotein